MSDAPEPGFKSVDRRRFKADGEPKSDPGPGPAEEDAASGLKGETFERHPGSEPQPPEVTFGTLCLSLHTQALFHMGLLRSPEGEVPPPNIPLARYTIDILHMLREKTRNNLSGDEGELLNGLLYELQMRYVSVTGKK